MERMIRNFAKKIIIREGHMLALKLDDQGESFHRIDMAFLCDYIGLIENASIQMDHNQIGYARINI